MPYLKIKTSNVTGSEWTTIDDLNLDKLTIDEATVTGEVTVSNFEQIKTTTPTTLPDFIDSKISTYVSKNTSPSFVFAANSSNSSTWTPSTGGLEASPGLFAIEERGDKYNLLWYSKKNGDSYSWARVHSIWG